MSNPIQCALAVTAGLALGLLFFGGLWWTVQRGLASTCAGLWFSGSFLVRTAIVLTGFYFAARAGWQGVICCAVGFLGGRVAIGRFTRLRERAE